MPSRPACNKPISPFPRSPKRLHMSEEKPAKHRTIFEAILGELLEVVCIVAGAGIIATLALLCNEDFSTLRRIRAGGILLAFLVIAATVIALAFREKGDSMRKVMLFAGGFILFEVLISGGIFVVGRFFGWL